MPVRRRVFFSFHYKQDSWRVRQIRNIGAIERNQPVSDNDWETVKRGGDKEIKRWISEQMYRRSCTVVLVGSNTANRKWINHEIRESWDQCMGVVGIHIHGLKDSNGRMSEKGENPFEYIMNGGVRNLSEIVNCYTPEGKNSQERYRWISTCLPDIIEEAIEIRERH